MAPDVDPEAARPATLTWSLVIPVKVLAQAKSRLTGLAGRAGPSSRWRWPPTPWPPRSAADAVAAVLVVTDDPEVADDRGRARRDRARLTPRPRGLNEALAHGAAYAQDRWPERGRAGLAGDLPALRPGELTAALAAAARLRRRVRARRRRHRHHAVRRGAGCAVPAAVRPGITGPAPGDGRGRDRASRRWHGPAPRRRHDRRPAPGGEDRPRPADQALWPRSATLLAAAVGHGTA